MPGLLQPRLSCFYCGSRSAYAKDGKTRQFTCTKCEATNYLDQKGEITDPPTTPSKPQSQVFAHARAKSLSPNAIADDNLFCKTCLKNQHILTTCLADYLPSEDDPDYEKYERQYPQYRKDLERRYPQVCPQCAPRVQERIRKTGYAAKVDFLTRSIERSKTHPVASNSTTASLFAIALNIVTVAWWASMLLQAVWHSLGLLNIPADQEQVSGMQPLMVIGCTISAAQYRFLPPGCSHLFADMVGRSIQLSLFLIWWNPALKTKLRSPGTNYQWTGLAEFYRFQCLILAARTAAWWKLTQPASQSSASNITQGIHGGALLFILIGALASQRMVNYKRVQRISFKDTSGPLVDPDSFHYPTDSLAPPPTRPSVSSLRPSPVKPFDISSLSSRHGLDTVNQLSSASPVAAPPTPPPEFDPGPSSHPDADDSMDWEPLPRHTSPILRRTHLVPSMTSSFPPPQPMFTPAVSSFLRRPATAAAGEKSPFTGRLPPAPISPAHRLRNPPPPQNQFKPTPPSKQRDFFKQMGLTSAALPLDAKQDSRRRRRSSSDESDATVASQTYVHSAADKEYFRPAQWTLKSDLDAAAKGTGTGLEDIFSTSFKLGDDAPASSSSQRSPRRQEVGGDGREIFERASAQTAAAAKIVGRELRLFLWPTVFVLLAFLVATARDPAGRQWISDLVTEALNMVKPAGAALGGDRDAPTSTHEWEVGSGSS